MIASVAPIFIIMARPGRENWHVWNFNVEADPVQCWINSNATHAQGPSFIKSEANLITKFTLENYFILCIQIFKRYLHEIDF